MRLPGSWAEPGTSIRQYDPQQAAHQVLFHVNEDALSDITGTFLRCKLQLRRTGDREALRLHLPGCRAWKPRGTGGRDDDDRNQDLHHHLHAERPQIRS